MKYGVFNIFWDKYPNHLPFLNLMESDHDSKEWNLQTSIYRLYLILETSSKKELNESLDLLLQSEDWRPHLVAIISLLTINTIERERFINKLWERLARGSWVSPQILIVLSIIDKDFTNKAETILKEEFKVSFINTSATEHHASRGGVSAGAAKAKIIEAIHYILSKTLQDINDIEEGGTIAKGWSERLFELADKGQLQIKEL